MIREVIKKPKVALCRQCGGTGVWRRTDENGNVIKERCAMCDGAGRVTVSAVMQFDIRPYRQMVQPDSGIVVCSMVD